MNNIAKIESRAIVPNYGMSDLERMAVAFARSGLFGAKTPDQALALCLIAQAEGKHPAIAAKSYHIINGNPSKKADAMLGDFQAAGGRVEWHIYTDAAVSATFSHPEGGSVRIDWDNARVQTANLGANPMHKKYPRAMKRARCISEGVRTVYPGATSGMYAPEELQDGGELTPLPASKPITAADLLEQAGASPHRPSPASSPDAAAGEPSTDAGPPEAASMDTRAVASRDWATKTIDAIEAAPDRAALAALQLKRAAGLAKLRDALPDLADAIDNAFAARLAALDIADAEVATADDGDAWRDNPLTAG